MEADTFPRVRHENQVLFFSLSRPRHHSTHAGHPLHRYSTWSPGRRPLRGTMK